MSEQSNHKTEAPLPGKEFLPRLPGRRANSSSSARRSRGFGLTALFLVPLLAAAGFLAGIFTWARPVP